MKYALFEEKRIEATKGAKGICEDCGSELIAKCGEQKIKHWAHKGKSNCDPWWEPETEWHRSWKNNFPFAWQEFSFRDEQTGEIHRADVHTSHGIVVEFQHSHLDPKERDARQNFYKRMIWVVDGARLKRDYPRFFNSRHRNLQATNKKGVYFVDFPEECFPNAWLKSSVPVVFDFRGTEIIKDPKDLRNNLYYLFPTTEREKTVLAVIPPEFFIKNIVINGEWIKKEEPQKQVPVPPVTNNVITQRRQPEYILHRGRWVKRRRF